MYNRGVALTVYHYPNCSTCKKAIAWLKAKKIDHTLVDIVKSPPSAAQLKNAQKSAGVPMKKMFNTSGASYRDGKFGEKLPGMTDAQAIAALAKDGKLIKRPLAVGDGVALVGFDETAWRSALT